MKSLSLNAYRFSVSWSRVFPEGVGRVNEKGLDFYRRLVDALLGAGIEPFGTLFHWDLPAALEDRGGFLNRDVAGWFADYAGVVCRALPGVASWATLNEPWVVMHEGYVNGIHPPGAPQPRRGGGRGAQPPARARRRPRRVPRRGRTARRPRRQPRAEVPGVRLSAKTRPPPPARTPT